MLRHQRTPTNISQEAPVDVKPEIRVLYEPIAGDDDDAEVE